MRVGFGSGRHTPAPQFQGKLQEKDQRKYHRHGGAVFDEARLLTPASGEERARFQTLWKLHWPSLLPSKQNRLSSAIRKNDLPRVKKLLSEGVNVNGRDRSGHTPLMMAALHDRIELVRLLLAEGASPAFRTQDGGSALSHAVEGNTERDRKAQAELVNLLVTPGTVNLPGYRDNTPLIHAAKNGLGEAARNLLAHGADPALANEEGMTPLMYAAWTGDADLARELILALPMIHRRDYVNRKNKWQRTAMDIIAGRKDRKDVRSLLFSFGGLSPKQAESADESGGDVPLEDQPESE